MTSIQVLEMPACPLTGNPAVRCIQSVGVALCGAFGGPGAGDLSHLFANVAVAGSLDAPTHRPARSLDHSKGDLITCTWARQNRGLAMKVRRWCSASPMARRRRVRPTSLQNSRLPQIGFALHPREDGGHEGQDPRLVLGLNPALARLETRPNARLGLADPPSLINPPHA